MVQHLLDHQVAQPIHIGSRTYWPPVKNLRAEYRLHNASEAAYGQSSSLGRHATQSESFDQTVVTIGRTTCGRAPYS